jgi:hypothetical protein
MPRGRSPTPNPRYVNARRPGAPRVLRVGLATVSLTLGCLCGAVSVGRDRCGVRAGGAGPGRRPARRLQEHLRQVHPRGASRRRGTTTKTIPMNLSSLYLLCCGAYIHYSLQSALVLMGWWSCAGWTGRRRGRRPTRTTTSRRPSRRRWKGLCISNKKKKGLLFSLSHCVIVEIPTYFVMVASSVFYDVRC